MFHVGFVKIAAIGTAAPIGVRGGVHNFSKPARIDPVTKMDHPGATTKAPFSTPIGKFGHRPRMALKAMSLVRGRR